MKARQKLNNARNRAQKMQPLATAFQVSFGQLVYSSHLLLKRNGLRLCANSTETLEKVIFDTNKKTVAVEVSNKKREDVPRIADISDDTFFFDKLRENMEDVLSTGGFTCTAVNEDRTVFEVQ